MTFTFLKKKNIKQMLKKLYHDYQERRDFRKRYKEYYKFQTRGISIACTTIHVDGFYTEEEKIRIKKKIDALDDIT